MFDRDLNLIMMRCCCKSILLGVFLGAIIFVEAKPAESDARTIQVPNKSDSAQMLDRSGKWRLWPRRSSSRHTRNPANIDEDSSLQMQYKKLSEVVVATSSAETATLTDIECKSESKPLFLKKALNRLRSSKSPPSPDDVDSIGNSATIKQRIPSESVAASPLKCRSRSNALDLKMATDSPSVFKHLRDDKQYDLQSSASHHAPASVAGVWYRTFQRQPTSTPAPMSFDTIGNEVRDKFQPFAPPFLPPSFSYYPFFSPSSLLDPDYYQAVAAAAIRQQSSTNKVDVTRTNMDNGHGKPTTSVTEQSTIRGTLLKINGNGTRHEWRPSSSPPPLTKIILKPQASATAGKQGIAISSPISTAYVKRGDYVEIEYLPMSKADVGEGGVAISRPELVIHFLDRRK